MRNLIWIMMLLLLLPLCFGCGTGGEVDHSTTTTTTVSSTTTTTLADPPSLIVPYVNSADMAVESAYSSVEGAPWGDAHLGIDFHSLTDLATFQAVCSGEIEKVEVVLLESTGNWQVEVKLRYNPSYSVFYFFEPMTTLEADGQSQLTNISVSSGETVASGDIIGYLCKIGAGAHVHWGLYLETGEGICPKPYFTDSARTDLLDLIHRDNPTWDICYPW